MKLDLAACVAAAACRRSARRRTRRPTRAGNAGGRRVARRQRRRHGRALLCRQAVAARRQACDRRKQAGHDPVARRGCGREGAARRLHDSDHVGDVVARSEPVQLQEAALRPDQGLHPGRHAPEELLHPDGARRGALEDRGRADSGDEGEGRQGELRLWQPAGARIGRALQGARRPEGGRHSLQDLNGVAAGDVQRRTRLPVHRLDAGHAADAGRQAARARGHSGQRVPGVDLPTMAEAANIPEFDIAPAWGVFLPAGAPARSWRGWNRGLPRSGRWTRPGSSWPAPMPRRFRAAPRSWPISSQRKSRNGKSSRGWPRSSRSRSGPA